MQNLGDRDLRIDNAKGALILLVVFGHLLELAGGWRSPARGLILTTLYAFHMPAFIFLAGVTARRTDTLRRVTILGFLLVVFHLAYQAQEYVREGSFQGSRIEPYWLLWFLMAMIWYTLITPVIARIPASLALGLAIVVALAAGLIPMLDDRLAGSRTLVFLPFFVAGHLYGPALIQRDYSKLSHVAVVALTVALALAIGACIFFAELPRMWVFGSRGYAELEVHPGLGVAIRAILLACSAIVTLGLIAASPKGPTILTAAGRYSLAVFLLHGLIVRAITDFFEAFDGFRDWLIIPAVALAIPLVMLLGRDGPDRIIRKMAANVTDFALGSLRRLSRRT